MILEEPVGEPREIGALIGLHVSRQPRKSSATLGGPDRRPAGVQFHNTLAGWYDNPMHATSRSTLLGRLRASERLAVLMLLVFALKIATAAACAKHDFGDLGLGTGDAHGVIVKALDADAANDLSKTAFGHAGACSHCSSHHASALPNESILVFASISAEAVMYRSGTTPSAAPRLELRPPIV